MQTQTITTYSFDELPVETQEQIADSWRNDDYFFWGDEWRDSLHKFADCFGLHVKDWCIDLYGQSYVEFEFEDDNYYKFYFGENNLATSEIGGVRLYKLIINNHFISKVIKKDCPFTGFCGDESLLKPIRDFIKQPCKHTSFYELIDECFDNWIKDYKVDLEYWHSFDCIKEEILANDYQFTANGDLFRK